jgi:hypothetical protein
MGATILIYGGSKVGKTLDVCHTLRKSVVLLAEPDGLASVTMHLGFTPPHIELTNLNEPEVELFNAINVLKPKMLSGDCSSVILDTGTELANRMLASYRKRWPKNGFGAFGFVQDVLQGAIRELQTTPAAFIMLCHEKEPIMKDGIFYKGGPLMPTSALTKTIPSMFSLIMHARIDKRWGRVYDCNKGETNWQVGDRYGATANLQPLDLRPIMWRIVRPGEPMPDFPEKPIRVVEEPFALDEEEKEGGSL